MQEEDEKKALLYSSNPDMGSALRNIKGSSVTE